MADLHLLSLVSEKIAFLKRKAEVSFDSLKVIGSEITPNKIGAESVNDMDAHFNQTNQSRPTFLAHQDVLLILIKLFNRFEMNLMKWHYF